jgi:hypothetical protein
MSGGVSSDERSTPVDPPPRRPDDMILAFQGRFGVAASTAGEQPGRVDP